MSSTLLSTHIQSSPLSRTTSPFKDPRPPPCTPGKSAKLWDKYEKRAVENARDREAMCPNSTGSAQRSIRSSNGTLMDVIKSYDPHSSPRVPCPSPSIKGSPHFDFGFKTSRKTWKSLPITTVATCKTCMQPIPSSLGVCERCKKTIVLPSQSGESTPPLSPACRNFASTDLPQLQKTSSSGTTTPTSASPKRKSRRPSSTQMGDLPIRLSSLRPPPPFQDSPRSSTESPCPRKVSLTDPNEPFLRLQTSRKPVPLPASDPSTPTTPPSTSRSHHSASRTRPPSLAKISTPAAPTTYSSTRHTSATPSELSSMYPYITSSTATSPPSLCRASYQLQHTTSAWDNWDSEEEEEKAGLVRYWRGRKWRGSRGSLGGHGGGEDRASGSVSLRRDSVGKAQEGTGKKRRGFVRVISCGCAED